MPVFALSAANARRLSVDMVSCSNLSMRLSSVENDYGGDKHDDATTKVVWKYDKTNKA